MSEHAQGPLLSLRCSDCGAIAGGENNGEFCGASLPYRNTLLRALADPLRVLYTYLLVAFMPWRAGRYIAKQKKGALAGLKATLGWAAGLFYAAQLAAVGTIGAFALFGFDGQTWQGKLVFYIFFGSLMLFLALLFHGFVRAFGSNETLRATLIGISYALAVWFLVTAALLTLHVGLIYQMLSIFTPSPLPWWQWLVEALTVGWLWGVLIVIQSKIHSLRWYWVGAAATLAGVGYCGWLLYFTVREYSCYFN